VNGDVQSSALLRLFNSVAGRRARPIAATRQFLPGGLLIDAREILRLWRAGL
jgi:hypothetical protein